MTKKGQGFLSLSLSPINDSFVCHCAFDEGGRGEREIIEKKKTNFFTLSSMSFERQSFSTLSLSQSLMEAMRDVIYM